MGDTAGGATGLDWLIARYDSAGAKLWEYHHNGTANGNERPTDLVIDGGGNVYVAGTSEETGTGTDAVVLKLDPSGSLVWKFRYDDSAHGTDLAGGLAVDSQGQVWLAGSANKPSVSLLPFTLKLDANGALLWEKTFQHPASAFATVNGLALDGDGNVSVCALSYGNAIQNPTGYDIVVIRYNTAGDRLWANWFNTPNLINSFDSPRAVMVDGSGNTYVTGVGGGGSLLTLKYSAQGGLDWSRGYHAPSSDSASGVELARGADGNLLILGNISKTSTDYNMALLKYTPTGDLLWIKQFDGPAHGLDAADDLTQNAEGKIFVAGQVEISDTDEDAILLQFDPDGNLEVTRNYGRTGRHEDGTGVAIGADGQVYFCGSTENAAGDRDALVVSYPNALRVPTETHALLITNLSIHVTWNDTTPDEQAFEVYRSAGNGAFTLRTTLGPSASSFDDTNLAPSTQYRYRVRALIGGIASGFSNEAGVLTGLSNGGKISAPASLNFRIVSYNKSRTLQLVVQNKHAQESLGVVVVGTSGDAFAGPNPGTLVIIAPKSAALLDVRFTPRGIAKRTGQLRLSASDPRKSTVTIKLQGKGL